MMKLWLRRILVVVAGLVIGGLVNGALIMVSGKVIAPPPGADVTTAEGLKASLHLFEPRHFVFPFLAHALGTFAGALAAAWWTPGRTPDPAYTVGGLFLLAGIANVVMLPAPLWFSALDLVVAYLPMAWLAHRLVTRA
jgi:hypothetical protein